MDNRLKRLTRVVLVLFGVLALRLVHLQVIQGDRYLRLSDRNRIRKIVRPAARGRFLDRSGRPLADTRPSYSLSVIPTEINDSVLPLLGRLLDLPVEELAARVRPIAFMSAPVKIRRNLAQPAVFALEENRFRLPGVIVTVDPVRTYPDGALCCHALGHLGEVSEEDMKQDSTLKPLDYVGRDGLEAACESLLRGRDGYEYQEVDARGHEIGPLAEKRPVLPVPGRDVRLTIDWRLQRRASVLLSGYARAAVVGLDCRTGAVLCFLSKPDFDPGIFTAQISAAEWRALADNPSKPFFNRVLGAAYPPGSIFKPFVALAGLRSGAVTPDSRFHPCVGQYKYGNRVFRCWGSHGSLDLAGAITQSCNSYFYQLGLALGLDSLAAYCSQFPMGTVTGIDLPGEAAGNIPTRSWLDERYGRGNWTSGTFLNFAIGQGEITMTPLQAAASYAAIAGGGTWPEPYLVERVDSAGRTVYRRPARPHRIALNQHHLTVVRHALERVVEYGTARAAILREVTIAGKTGTAQNTTGADHAWFAGYAPADAPEVVFVVLVENAGHGGSVAAPIVAELVRTWYSLPEESEPDSHE